MEEKPFDYINVIPFVDIMLVLLTIVLTTSTFIATGGIQVNLPSASRQMKEQTLKTKSIEIDRQGVVYFNGQPVTLNDLRAALAPLDRNTPFLIRADRQIQLQNFVDALDVVKQLGFKRVSLQTELRQ